MLTFSDFRRTDFRLSSQDSGPNFSTYFRKDGGCHTPTHPHSANSCANVIDNLKRIYSLFKSHFCDAMSSVVKYRRISQRISFNRHCLKPLHMNLHHSKLMCCTHGICILAPGANVSANMIFHPVFGLTVNKRKRLQFLLWKC